MRGLNYTSKAAFIACCPVPQLYINPPFFKGCPHSNTHCECCKPCTSVLTPLTAKYLSFLHSIFAIQEKNWDRDLTLDSAHLNVGYIYIWLLIQIIQ